MASTTPLLLADNVFDTVVQYPAATLTTTSEVVGREARRIADYRRDRTMWQSATSAANHAVTIDLGSGNTRACDYWFLDRGHNLHGYSIYLEYSANGSAWTTYSGFTMPPAGTVGGDPGGAVGAMTEEGAWYGIFSPSPARRYWRARVGDSIQPLLTGLMAGLRTQFTSYSNVYDPDQGARKQRTEESDAGRMATGRTASWRTLDIGMPLIGDTEYDGTIRALRRLLFERDQPCVIAMNYGDYPAQAWMYKYSGNQYSARKSRTYRSLTWQMREHDALVL